MNFSIFFANSESGRSWIEAEMPASRFSSPRCSTKGVTTEGVALVSSAPTATELFALPAAPMLTPRSLILRSSNLPKLMVSALSLNAASSVICTCAPKADR